MEYPRKSCDHHVTGHIVFGREFQSGNMAERGKNRFSAAEVFEALCSSDSELDKEELAIESSSDEGKLCKLMMPPFHPHTQSSFVVQLRLGGPIHTVILYMSKTNHDELTCIMLGKNSYKHRLSEMTIFLFIEY